MTNSYVLHCLGTQRIVHISATRCPIVMGFGLKCSILNGQVAYSKKLKLNTADMWLVPLDHATIYHQDPIALEYFQVISVCASVIEIFTDEKV